MHRNTGCANTRFVGGDHIHHWADGGETKLDNLILLFRRHHRFVHECGFRIERDAARVRFVRPDGRAVPVSPAPDEVDGDGWRWLTAAHKQLGLLIDRRTAVLTLPRFSGQP